MSVFQDYMRAEAEKDAAFQHYNYASQLLENRQIKCRFAELQSQSEPAKSIIGESGATREQLIAAARFVVLGRKAKEASA